MSSDLLRVAIPSHRQTDSTVSLTHSPLTCATSPIVSPHHARVRSLIFISSNTTPVATPSPHSTTAATPPLLPTTATAAAVAAVGSTLMQTSNDVLLSEPAPVAPARCVTPLVVAAMAARVLPSTATPANDTAATAIAAASAYRLSRRAPLVPDPNCPDSDIELHKARIEELLLAGTTTAAELMLIYERLTDRAIARGSGSTQVTKTDRDFC